VYDAGSRGGGRPHVGMRGGGAGLGFDQSDSQGRHMTRMPLCLIPLMCVLLCRIVVVVMVRSRGFVHMATTTARVVSTDVPLYNEDPEAMARGQMRPRRQDLNWQAVGLLVQGTHSLQAWGGERRSVPAGRNGRLGAGFGIRRSPWCVACLGCRVREALWGGTRADPCLMVVSVS
jgi:hypothetical protein